MLCSPHLFTILATTRRPAGENNPDIRGEIVIKISEIV
jgi:hypothetical protein